MKEWVRGGGGAHMSICKDKCIMLQGGREHWDPNFIITVSYSLAQELWGLLLYFDWLVFKVECPNVFNH